MFILIQYTIIIFLPMLIRQRYKQIRSRIIQQVPNYPTYDVIYIYKCSRTNRAFVVGPRAQCGQSLTKCFRKQSPYKMTKWNGRIYIRSRKYIYEFQRLSYYKSMNYIHEKFSKASPCPQCSVFDKQMPFLISCNHVNFCPKKTRHVIVYKLTFF